MQKSHTLVTAGFGICNSCQTVELESHSIAPLSSIHVVSKCKNQLQHTSQTFASLNFFTSLQNGQNFWFDLIVPDVELLLVMERSQSLLVMRYPAINISYLQLRDTRRPFFMLPRHGK